MDKNPQNFDEFPWVIRAKNRNLYFSENYYIFTPDFGDASLYRSKERALAVIQEFALQNSIVIDYLESEIE